MITKRRINDCSVLLITETWIHLGFQIMALCYNRLSPNQHQFSTGLCTEPLLHCTLITPPLPPTHVMALLHLLIRQ